jgi:hypothetical protein
MLSDILLKSMDPKNTQAIKLIRAIFSASSLSNFLINDLMDYQLLETGNFKIKFEWFDL